MSTAKDLKWLRMAIFGGREFSTCTNRQFMAIILDADGIEVGTGWNGAPSGMVHCTDGGCPRSILHQNVTLGSTGRGTDYENCVAVHAESNALLHSDWSRRQNGTIYVGGPPCWDCAKLIANSGLKRVVCLADDTAPNWERTKRFLDDLGIEVVVVSTVGEP